MSKKNDLEILDLNLDDEGIVASAAEMTGLTPTPIKSGYEADSYLDILPYTGPLNPGSSFPVTDHPVGNANPYKFKEKFTDRK